MDHKEEVVHVPWTNDGYIIGFVLMQALEMLEEPAWDELEATRNVL